MCPLLSRVVVSFGGTVNIHEFMKELIHLVCFFIVVILMQLVIVEDLVCFLILTILMQLVIVKKMWFPQEQVEKRNFF